MTVKMVFTIPLLGAQHERHAAEEMRTILFVVSLGKALNGLPHLHDLQEADKGWGRPVHTSR